MGIQDWDMKYSGINVTGQCGISRSLKIQEFIQDTGSNTMLIDAQGQSDDKKSPPFSILLGEKSENKLM